MKKVWVYLKKGKLVWEMPENMPLPLGLVIPGFDKLSVKRIENHQGLKGVEPLMPTHYCKLQTFNYFGKDTSFYAEENADMAHIVYDIILHHMIIEGYQPYPEYKP